MLVSILALLAYVYTCCHVIRDKLRFKWVHYECLLVSSNTHTVIPYISVFLFHPNTWLEVGAIVWKMAPCQSPAMSTVRWHVDSSISWMQIKREMKKSYQNTTDIWQLLVSGSLFISAPGILKINGFCTDAICCQDWCFSLRNKVLLVL